MTILKYHKLLVMGILGFIALSLKTRSLTAQDNSNDNTYPWLAAIVQENEAGNKVVPGAGALVHPYWVLTSAKLFIPGIPYQQEMPQLAIGKTNLAALTEADYSTVEEIIVHPEFNLYTGANDVALLRLSNPVTGPTISINSNAALAAQGMLLQLLAWGPQDPQDSLTPLIVHDTAVNVQFDDKLGYDLVIMYNTSSPEIPAITADKGSVVIAKLNDNSGLNILIRFIAPGSNQITDHYYSDNPNHPTQYSAVIADIINYIDSATGTPWDINALSPFIKSKIMLNLSYEIPFNSDFDINFQAVDYCGRYTSILKVETMETSIPTVNFGSPIVGKNANGQYTLFGLLGSLLTPTQIITYTPQINKIRPWVLQHTAPQYADWEMRNQVFGTLQDADHDNHYNFIEYAFGSNPHKPNATALKMDYTGPQPLLHFMRPTSATDEINYSLQFSPTLRPDAWSELDPVSDLIDRQPVPATADNLERLSYKLPLDNPAFMKAELQWASNLAHTLRKLRLSVPAYSSLTSLSQRDTDGNTYQDFLLAKSLDPRTPLVVAISANQFVPSLALHPASQHSPRSITKFDQASGHHITYIAVDGSVSNTIRVSAPPGSEGTFSIRAHDGLTLDSDTDSAFTEADMLYKINPFWHDYSVHKRFSIMPTNSTNPPVQITANSDLALSLMLFDIATEEPLEASTGENFDGIRPTITLQPHHIGTTYIVVLNLSGALQTGTFTLQTQPL